MKTADITKAIFSKKTQDYTFVVLFLLIFSVFIFFAINPSLKTAFSLKKEEKDLTKIDALYEQKIINIASIQSQIEENREDIPLFNQAISEFPEVNKMVNDIKSAADKNSFVIKKSNIADVNLAQNKKALEKIRMIVEAKTNFDNLISLIQDLFLQRRLKSVSNLVINQDQDATGSGELEVILTIEIGRAHV